MRQSEASIQKIGAAIWVEFLPLMVRQALRILAKLFWVLERYLLLNIDGKHIHMLFFSSPHLQSYNWSLIKYLAEIEV